MPNPDCKTCLGSGWETLATGVRRCACEPARQVSGAFFGAELPPRERAVWQVLQNHRGRKSAIKMPELAAKTGTNTRELQSIVARLINDFGAQIGSTSGKPAGYFLIENDQERIAAEKNLISRITELAKRLRALNRGRWRDLIRGLYEGD